MAKFQEPKLCLSMYEKMLEEKLKPDLNVYHALLQCPKEAIDEHWLWIENVFKLMRDNEIHPTVKTFNLAMLSMLRHPKKSDKTKDRCMQIFRVSETVVVSIGNHYIIIATVIKTKSEMSVGRWFEMYGHWYTIV